MPTMQIQTNGKIRMKQLKKHFGIKIDKTSHAFATDVFQKADKFDQGFNPFKPEGTAINEIPNKKTTLTGRETCQICKGVGKIGTRNCYNCNGKGYVY